MKRLTKRLWLVSLLTLAMSCKHSTPPKPEAQTTPLPGKAETEPAAQKATEATPIVAPSGGTVAPGTVAAPKPRPVKVKIVVRSNPPKANVFWGKKPLGPTPVTLERPRDSGPVDLIVRADGYFPLHTRAYTFRNDGVWVKLTKLEDRMNLFGAKHDANETPVTAPPDGEPAVPPPAAAAPAPTP
jgi:PEGA domain